MFVMVEIFIKTKETKKKRRQHTKVIHLRPHSHSFKHYNVDLFVMLFVNRTMILLVYCKDHFQCYNYAETSTMGWEKKCV